tara:strand:+ start:3699 stop:6047 length:2349 start_codon:yes stop_codon:yes gene_type:complete
MNNKWVIILLTILLVIPITSAFELNSNELTKTTCQGNTLLFTANVFGTGNFNINLGGSASSWSTSVPNGFILNNNGRTIYVYSTPNQNVNPGSYDLNLIVSNQEETKTIPLTVNVENCHELQLTGETLKEICQEEITSFGYQLTNNGIYDEEYNLEVEGSDSFTLSQDLISLNSGESKNVFVYTSQNAISSPFTLSAFNQYGTNEITSELKVNSCYDFTLSTDKDFVNFCEHSTENVAITVTNAGINQDSYNLEVNGPRWINLDQQSLVLNPQQSGSVNLVLSPNYGIEGNFDIDLIINSKETSKARELKAQVNKCYDVFLNIQEKEISLCNNAQTPLLVKNTGSFEKEFRLETSEQWALLNNYQINLQPGEESNVNLLLNVEGIERNNYDVFVNALALDGSGLSVDDKIKVKLLEEVECHNTGIVSSNSFEVTQGSSTTLPVTIKNNGNEKLIYEISLTGEGSSFTQLNPSILELEANEGETIYLYSAPSIEVNSGSYGVDISVSYNNNLLASKSINVNVKESEFNQKEYTSFLRKIANFFKEIFPKQIVSDVDEVPEEPKEEEPKEEENTTKYVPISLRFAGWFKDLFSINNITEVEEPVEEESKEEPLEDSNKTGFVSGLYNQAKSYWLYIIVGIAIIIILIIIFSAGDKEEDEFDEDWDDDEEIDMKEEVKEEKEDEFDEDWDDDDEEEPLKVGRWVLGIIVILGLIYLQMNYSFLGSIQKYFLMSYEYLILYKFYILIALIILLIAILIIKYWGSILEFFEEEDEEEPKKKLKKNKK